MILLHLHKSVKDGSLVKRDTGPILVRKVFICVENKEMYERNYALETGKTLRY